MNRSPLSTGRPFEEKIGYSQRCPSRMGLGLRPGTTGYDYAA